MHVANYLISVAKEQLPCIAASVPLPYIKYQHMIPFTKNAKTIIAWLTIGSGLIALACLLLGLHATHYDSEAFENPVKLLTMSSINANLIRWFMLLDMFGYYLLLLPIIFYAHHQLQQKTAWASCITSLGFAYVLIGSTGAAILAVIWPALLIDFNGAAQPWQEIIKSDFVFATNLVAKGMWNYLEVLLAGFWWLGLGYFIVKDRALKVITYLLSAACLLDSLGELVQLPLLAEIGLNVYLLLGIVWPVWVGVAVLKNKF
jgi:hypothetical protein